MASIEWLRDELIQQFPECRTLGEVVQKMEKEWEGRGEMICEIRVNGMLLSEQDETKFADSPIDQITHLSLQSGQVPDLVVNLREAIPQWVDHLQGKVIACSEHFRERKPELAHRAFSQVIDGCQLLVDSARELSRREPGSTPLDERAKDLSRVVHELLAAYQTKDFVLLADLLEYELPSALDTWKKWT